ncbi:MAG: hypothetical protein ABIB71_02100 [Candidatus Woesearchaeota archaeon]
MDLKIKNNGDIEDLYSFLCKSLIQKVKISKAKKTTSRTLLGKKYTTALDFMLGENGGEGFVAMEMTGLIKKQTLLYLTGLNASTETIIRSAVKNYSVLRNCAIEEG